MAMKEETKRGAKVGCILLPIAALVILGIIFIPRLNIAGTWNNITNGATAKTDNTSAPDITGTVQKFQPASRYGGPALVITDKGTFPLYGARGFYTLEQTEPTPGDRIVGHGGENGKVFFILERGNKSLATSEEKKALPASTLSERQRHWREIWEHRPKTKPVVAVHTEVPKAPAPTKTPLK